MSRHATSDTAVDLLESVDLELLEMFGRLQDALGPSVEARDEYGRVAKNLIRCVATRESALADVTKVVSEIPELGTTTTQLEGQMDDRRTLIDKVERMSRGVQAINLNTGQEFDAVLQELVELLSHQIGWDLERGIPTIRKALAGDDRAADLKSAKYLTRHAPTNLDPRGPRWFEHAPFVSRLITVYDHLRDFPRARDAHQNSPT